MKTLLYLFCASSPSFISFHVCASFSLHVQALIKIRLRKLRTLHRAVILLALRTLLFVSLFALLGHLASSLCFSYVIASPTELLFPFPLISSKQAPFLLVFSWLITRLSASFSPSLFVIFLLHLTTILLLQAAAEVPFLSLD